MYLPKSNFSWVDDCNNLIKRLPDLSINDEFGFIAEVDLKIPEHLHDIFDDFPLAPIRQADCQISQYMEILWNKNENCKYKRQEKLFLTHEDKNNYVIHFALLQFFLKLGVILTKIHRAISFHQEPFFK